MSDFHHIPVLFEETISGLLPRDGGRYIDCTFGGGGHSIAILERSAPGGQLLALDRDPLAIEHGAARLAPFGGRAILRKGAFSALLEWAKEEGFDEVDGILADIGTSSPQLDRAERGFSFQQDGPLDMRMDTESGETALELIERLDTDELADTIYAYGDERRSRAIARSIKESLGKGELETTLDLRRAITRVLGPKRGKTDPATRTFQAIRIAVNDELGELKKLLEDAPSLLKVGGRIAIITFHSHEDRLVKWAFREDPRLKVITKKPIVASEEELRENPRARPAKLRVAERQEPQEPRKSQKPRKSEEAWG